VKRVHVDHGYSEGEGSLREYIVFGLGCCSDETDEIEKREAVLHGRLHLEGERTLL